MGSSKSKCKLLQMETTASEMAHKLLTPVIVLNVSGFWDKRKIAFYIKIINLKLTEFESLVQINFFLNHFKMSCQTDAISDVNVSISYKKILLHNQNTAIKIRELTPIQCYFILRPHLIFNWPNNVL